MVADNRVAMKNQRLLIVLLWLGNFLLLYGLGAAFIDLRFRPLYIVSSIAGLIFLAVVIFRIRQKVGRIPWLSSFKRCSSIVIYCIVLTAALSFINYLTFRYNVRWDFTKAKQHTLTANTLELIKALKIKVKLTAFYVGLPPKYLEVRLSVIGENKRRIEVRSA